MPGGMRVVRNARLAACTAPSPVPARTARAQNWRLGLDEERGHHHGRPLAERDHDDALGPQPVGGPRPAQRADQRRDLDHDVEDDELRHRKAQGLGGEDRRERDHRIDAVLVEKIRAEEAAQVAVAEDRPRRRDHLRGARPRRAPDRHAATRRLGQQRRTRAARKPRRARPSSGRPVNTPSPARTETPRAARRSTPRTRRRSPSRRPGPDSPAAPARAGRHCSRRGRSRSPRCRARRARIPRPACRARPST